MQEPVAGNYFVSTYPPFSCWREEATARYVDALGKPPSAPGSGPLGLYVHVPFCVDRCHYCYYLSHDDRLDEMDGYVDGLVAELSIYVAMPALAGRLPDFVYFGGGTPSLLSLPRVERLVQGLQRLMPWVAAREVTFECAPRSVTEQKLRALREAGVTRISLGVQQLDDDVLRANGRVHLIGDVERAYELVRRVGFDVVNLDLIVGLVGETDASYLASLDRVIALAPDTVTTYQLEIPLNTPLWHSIRDGSLGSDVASWEIKRARLRDGIERLVGAGYTRTSAYAVARDPERHHFIYQREQYHGVDLLGIGTSAFSHLAGFNQQNRTRLSDYLACTRSGELPLLRAYELSDEERMVREFILQLKLGGVRRAYFVAKFGTDVVLRFQSRLTELVAKGWLEVDDERVSVTPEGLLRVDRILPCFYLPEHQGVRYS